MGSKLNVKAEAAKTRKLKAKGVFELGDIIKKQVGNVGSGKDYYQSGREARASTRCASLRMPIVSIWSVLKSPIDLGTGTRLGFEVQMGELGTSCELSLRPNPW